jgi:hypothetical protein
VKSDIPDHVARFVGEHIDSVFSARTAEVHRAVVDLTALYAQRAAPLRRRERLIDLGEAGAALAADLDRLLEVRAPLEAGPGRRHVRGLREPA